MLKPMTCKEVIALVECSQKSGERKKIWWSFVGSDTMCSAYILPSFHVRAGTILSGQLTWMRINRYLVFDNYFKAWGYSKLNGLDLWPESIND